MQKNIPNRLQKVFVALPQALLEKTKKVINITVLGNIKRQGGHSQYPELLQCKGLQACCFIWELILMKSRL